MLPFSSPQVTILAQCFDEAGIVRCPVENNSYFGITFLLDYTQSPSKLVVSKIIEKLDLKEGKEGIEVIGIVEPVFQRSGFDPTVLFLVKLPQNIFQAPSHWPTFVSHLKQLGSGSERVAYNKAFQYFFGAHLGEVDVLELDSQVKKRLEELEAQRHLNR